VKKKEEEKDAEEEDWEDAEEDAWEEAVKSVLKRDAPLNLIKRNASKDAPKDVEDSTLEEDLLY